MTYAHLSANANDLINLIDRATSMALLDISNQIGSTVLNVSYTPATEGSTGWIYVTAPTAYTNVQSTYR